MKSLSGISSDAMEYIPRKKFGFFPRIEAIIGEDDGLYLIKRGKKYNPYDLHDYDPDYQQCYLLESITPLTGKRIARKIADWVYEETLRIGPHTSA